jgi:hypothetical protein
MGRIVDTAMAVRFLQLLVTPFEKTDAFKLGVIDKDGVPLKKVDTLNSEEADSYSLLHRIVFKLKRLLGKLPAGKSMMASITAALILVKEDLDELEFEELLEELVPFITEDEEQEVRKIYEETGIAAVAGVAMPDGSPDKEPPVRGNQYKKRNMVRRKPIGGFIIKQ